MEPIKANARQEKLLRDVFGLKPGEDLPELYPIYGGLTNSSFRFTCRGEDFFLREPGYDTDAFVNRRHEAAVYEAINDPGLTDELVLLEPETGRKITRFWNDSRICDPENDEDVKQCMALLREFHSRQLHVGHRYDLYALIGIFRRMMPEKSIYEDYEEVEKRCLDMKPYLERYQKYAVLCHCDTSYTNFLFVGEGETRRLHLIDWEYSGEHDPCLDIAVFANAANYDHEKLSWLMNCYLGSQPTKEFVLRVYGYGALTCLLWSNWAEYKERIGEDCAGYGPQQYRCAAEYSKLFWELLPHVLGEEDYG